MKVVLNGRVIEAGEVRVCVLGRGGDGKEELQFKFDSKGLETVLLDHDGTILGLKTEEYLDTEAHLPEPAFEDDDDDEEADEDFAA